MVKMIKISQKIKMLFSPAEEMRVYWSSVVLRLIQYLFTEMIKIEI